jgi:hypothetical protein
MFAADPTRRRRAARVAFVANLGTGVRVVMGVPRARLRRQRWTNRQRRCETHG